MNQNFFRHRAQRGFTLIELMVALLLGLLVVAAAGSIFLSNRRVYGSTESLNRIQENQRTAFEIMARDIREAGGNPCLRLDAGKPPVQQLSTFDTTWWGRYVNGIHGTSNSLTLFLANGRQYPVVQHRAPADPVTLASVEGLAAGQELMICNNDEAIVFSVSAISGTALQHTAGVNCGSSFTLNPDPGQCGSSISGLPTYCFWGDPTVLPSNSQIGAGKCQAGVGRAPSFVVRPYDAQWTVEANARGGSSLYRAALGSKDEIAEGVVGMSIDYKVGNGSAYQSAADVEAANAWGQVTAVHLALTFEATRGAMSKGDVEGVDGSTLSRTLEDFIVLRNHQGDIR